MDINAQLKEQMGFLDIQQAEASKDPDKREAVTINDFNMVTFSLSGKDYGIDIMNVKEIAKADRFTYVPNTLPFVRGVYNLRGEIIPILDLRLFFNNEVPPLGKDQLENLIILTVEEQMFGVVVDKIDKVVGLQKRTIQPPHPLFGDINIKYISGVAEANRRLYVLLDIDKIFNSRASVDEQTRKRMHQAAAQAANAQAAHVKMPTSASQAAPQAAKPAAAPSAKPAAQPAASVQNSAEFEKNLKFVKESLVNYKKFNVTPLNEQWVRNRFDEWCKIRGEGKTQLQNEDDAAEFLKPFWSKCNASWWTQQYSDEMFKLLPDNMSKQISVWNPGCGRGVETYSLACVLAKRYPDAKIKIYAQDTDLLAVSNAPLLTVPPEVAGGWFAPYISSKANGESTFTQDIKNSIMFEYHDCTHTNALPACDIIFARDVLSLLDAATQTTVVSDFNEKLKKNGTLVLGDNEILGSDSGFMERTVGSLTAYNK